MKQAQPTTTAAAKVPEGEHIFPNTALKKMALRWKELNEKGRHREAMEVLEEIIVASTQMFERLAQHEGFHYAVDLDKLVSAAQEKVVKWLLKWNPKKGSLFSWFSKCSKNAFKSEVLKESAYKNRFHVTSDNLEKFHGYEDHAVDRDDAVVRVQQSVRNISSRWGDPQEIAALRFMIECIIDEENHSKAGAIRGAAYAYGLAFDTSKFFYNWVLMEMRDQFYEQIHIPFTEQDLFRHANSYNHLVDVLNIISWDQMKKMIAVMGGSRLKIPTIAQMAKLSESYQIFREIDASDKDPEAIEQIAKAKKKSVRSATEIYHEMADTLNANRSGEYPIYDS